MVCVLDANGQIVRETSPPNTRPALAPVAREFSARHRARRQCGTATFNQRLKRNAVADLRIHQESATAGIYTNTRTDFQLGGAKRGAT
jgi:hypothetical protein